MGLIAINMHVVLFSVQNQYLGALYSSSMYVCNLHLQVFGVNLNVIYIGSKYVLVIIYIPSAGKFDRNVFFCILILLIV